MKTPLLILSDAPSAVTGLGRIARDLSIRIATNLSDVYEVATLGYGGFGDKSLPFMQYNIEEMKDWFIPNLPDVWNNFAAGRPGILMTIWDASRLLWLSRPEHCHDAQMQAWLKDRPFRLWGYFPVDASGPNGKLSVMQRECMLGYYRVLSYSKWAEQIMQNTMSDTRIDTRTHGIDTSVFYPRPVNRNIFHEQMGFKGPTIEPEQKMIGIVATNQVRKDWGLAIETCARIAKEVPLRIFIQTDILERHWSIPALLYDYGLAPNAIVNSLPLSDDTMCEIYSLCDLTLGIGLGEGFGFPIFESLACGTPCLTGSYGGHVEHMSLEMLMYPIAWRLDGLYNCRRPVFDSEKWAYRALKILRKRKTCESLLPKHLDWNNLWPEWQTWFRDGQIQLPTKDGFLAQSGSTSEMDTEKSDQSRSKAADLAMNGLTEDAVDDFVQGSGWQGTQFRKV